MADLIGTIDNIIRESAGEPLEAEQDGTRIKQRSLDELLKARGILSAAKSAADPLGAIKVRQRRGNSAV